MNMNVPLKIKGIVRVSTKGVQEINPDSGREYSLDEQQKLITEYCNTYFPGNALDILSFNNSAYNDSKYIQDFTQLLESENGLTIIFSRVDRCSRNVTKFTEWLELCKKKRHTLIFVEGNIHYSGNNNYRINHELINPVITAQQYSQQLSNHAKQVAKRNKRSREDGSYVNTSAFGRSFNGNRIYEIMILIVAKRLLSIDEKNPLPLRTLIELFNKIFNVMPISPERKREKINFLYRNSIEYKDKNDKRISSLTEPLTFDEIGSLFDEYAITFVNIKEDVETPIFTNSSKFITKHKIFSDIMYMIVHQKDTKGKIIEIALKDVITQLFPNASDEERNNRINECFTLNQTIFHKYTLKKATKLNLETNTILYLPDNDNWNVPELNIPSDLILKNLQLYQGKFINLEDEIKSFSEKCDSDENFREKLQNMDDDLSNSFEKNLNLTQNMDVNDIDVEETSSSLKRRKEESSFPTSTSKICHQIWDILQNKDTAWNQVELNSYLKEIGLGCSEDIEYLDNVQITRIQYYLKPLQQKKFAHLMNQVKNH
jgi:DNA invertase Pin-like site-specific DNA recombinase